jgi:hypothetical protein
MSEALALILGAVIAALAGIGGGALQTWLSAKTSATADDRKHNRELLRETYAAQWAAYEAYSRKSEEWSDYAYARQGEEFDFASDGDGLDSDMRAVTRQVGSAFGDFVFANHAAQAVIGFVTRDGQPIDIVRAQHQMLQMVRETQLALGIKPLTLPRDLPPGEVPPQLPGKS